MPYITKEERTEKLGLGLVNTREDLAISMGENAINGGQLNYMISLTISTYLKEQGLKYDICQDIMGILEIVKSEFIANVINPYEEVKEQENGGEIYNWVEDAISGKYHALYSSRNTE